MRYGVHPDVLDAEMEQLERWREELAAGASRIGWKLGYDIAEVEEVMGKQPVLGYVTTRTLLDDHGKYAASAAHRLRGEAELVVWLSDYVEAHASRGEIERAISGLSVGLELVDVARPPDGVRGIVRDNIFHRAVVLGTPSGASSTEARGATLAINGTRHHGERTVDVAATVRAVAQMLEVCGERLLAGDCILGGSLVHVPVAAGDHLVAEVEGLGGVTARITA